MIEKSKAAKLSRCVLGAVSIGVILTAYSPKTADAEFLEPANGTPVQCIPKLETAEMEPVSTDNLPHAVSVGTCTITYYCPCVRCNGNPDQVARDGSRLIPYVTCAVDPEMIPLGSDVWIDFGGGDVQYFRYGDGPEIIGGTMMLLAEISKNFGISFDAFCGMLQAFEKQKEDERREFS